MTDLGRSIKIGSDHLDAMKMRRERLIATVGDCMSKEDLDKGIYTFIDFVFMCILCLLGFMI